MNDLKNEEDQKQQKENIQAGARELELAAIVFWIFSYPPYHQQKRGTQHPQCYDCVGIGVDCAKKERTHN
jgi:hypothetical protein